MGPIYNCILTCNHGLGLGGPIQLESFLIIILDVWSRSNKGSMFGIRNCKCYKKITTKNTERGTKTPSKCIPPMWSQPSHKDEHNCRSTCTYAIGRCMRWTPLFVNLSTIQIVDLTMNGVRAKTYTDQMNLTIHFVEKIIIIIIIIILPIYLGRHSIDNWE